MTHAYYSKVRGLPAEVVWPTIRDFGALPVWFPFVESCVVNEPGAADRVGAVRTHTVNGGNVVREWLDERLPMAQTLGLGVTPSSPLGGGGVTGKYGRADLSQKSEATCRSRE